MFVHHRDRSFFFFIFFLHMYIYATDYNAFNRRIPTDVIVCSLACEVLNPIENFAVYTHKAQKLKELVNLSSLCKFQLFAINNKGNSCNPKLPNKPYHGFGSHLDKKATT